MTTSRPAPARRRTTTLAALAVAGALTAGLTLTGCAGPEDTDGPGVRGIDARSYVDDYDENQGGDTAYSSGPGAVMEDSGAAPGAPAPSEPSVPPAPRPTPDPDPDEDNTFVDAGASGFVDTVTDPLSTFALDVDTGSYGVARSLLEDGYRPPPASIRVEEWVNAMSYDDPAPTDADLGLSAESTTSPTLDGAQVLRVGVAAREVDPAERPRVNVTLAVDRSGSMDVRERLGLVQSSLALLADNLADDDTISLVSFEDQARPILPPTRVADTDTILEAIAELTPGGSTNLEAGLALAYDQAREAFDPDAVNVVVLASDGVANVGATGPGSITERIAEEGAEGIHLVTVGYGMGNYNDHLMEQLADLGDGFYSYVDTFAEAERLFGTDLVTTLTPVAGEARTQVSFDPALVSSYRLVGYDNRAIADEDFADMTVDAGELGSGHQASALYEVELVEGVQPGTAIGAATVQWRSIATGRTERAVLDLTAAEETPATDALALATTVADLAQLVKATPAYVERGVTLDDIAARVEALTATGVAGADELDWFVSRLKATE